MMLATRDTPCIADAQGLTQWQCSQANSGQDREDNDEPIPVPHYPAAPCEDDV